MQPAALEVVVLLEVEVLRVVLGGGVVEVLRDVLGGGGEPPDEPVVEPMSPHRMLEKMT